jgi:HEAT repeat protein
VLRPPRSCYHPSGRQVACALGVLLAAGMSLISGCQGLTPRMTPQQQADLDRRARTLLLNAAQSNDDIIARANAIEALVDVAPTDSLPIFRAAVAGESPLVRYAGCVALGETRDTASLKALRRLIEDPNPRIRMAAAFAACRCGDENAGSVLVEMLNDHPDEKVRADAAYLIGEIGEPKALKRLKLAASRENSGFVIVHIESAMAELGDRESIEKLLQYALKSDAVTIVLALQALAELGDPSARETLEYRLHNEADYLQSRLIAARGLGKLGVDDGYQLATKALRRSAKDDNETMQIRVNAALALGAIGQTRALPLLERLAERENDRRTQVAACYAICQIVSSSSLP